MSKLIVDDYSNVTVKIEENVVIKEEVYDSDDPDENIPLSDLITNRRGNVVEFCEDETRLIRPEPNEGGPYVSSNIGRGKSHVCLKCNRAFSRKDNLNRHIKCVHDKSKKYSCEECSRAFSQKRNLIIHLDAIHRKSKKYSCEECDYAFTQEEFYDSDDPDENIPLSDFIADGRGNVVEFCEDKTRFIKPEPNEGGPSGSSNIDDSGSSVRRVKSHVCLKCNRAFPQKSNLTRHIKCVHDKLKKYSCEECSRAFSQKIKLKSHFFHITEFCEDETRLIRPEPNEGGPSVSSNIGDSGSSVGRGKSHVCLKCNRAFSRKDNLNRHIKCVHDKSKKYSCEECSRAFSQKRNLIVHLDAIHRKSKKYSCEECDYAFTQEEFYDSDDTDENIPLSDFIADGRGNVVEFCEDKTRFIKPEPNEGGPSGSSNIDDSGSSVGRVKSHVCLKCNRAFSQKSNLTRHIKCVHDKLKKYSCEECSRAFSQKIKLKSHVDAIHRKLKKYLCEECDHAFARKSSLEDHILAVHRKLKKYSCGDCGRAFAIKSKLKVHVDVVHRKLKKLSCEECGRAVAQKTNLRAHIAAVRSELKK